MVGSSQFTIVRTWAQGRLLLGGDVKCGVRGGAEDPAVGNGAAGGFSTKGSSL